MIGSWANFKETGKVERSPRSSTSPAEKAEEGRREPRGAAVAGAGGGGAEDLRWKGKQQALETGSLNGSHGSGAERVT